MRSIFSRDAVNLLAKGTCWCTAAKWTRRVVSRLSIWILIRRWVRIGVRAAQGAESVMHGRASLKVSQFLQ